MKLQSVNLWDAANTVLSEKFKFIHQKQKLKNYLSNDTFRYTKYI